MLRDAGVFLAYASVIMLSFVQGAIGRAVPCDYVTKVLAENLALDDELDRRFYAAVHSVGNIVIVVSNAGLFADNYMHEYDYFTGMTFESGSEYPKFSGIDQTRLGTIWIGGIVGPDTLVSIGQSVMMINSPLYEFNPDPLPAGGLVTRSIGDPGSPGYEEAVSEQDIIAVYNDTCVWFYAMDNFWDGREHKPLFLEVVQKSYAWSADYAEDFVVFDLTVTNIGKETIHKAYFGVLIRPQVGFEMSYG